MNMSLHNGDCLEFLESLDTAKIDAVVSDPPYGMTWNTDSTRYSGGSIAHKRKTGRADWGVIQGNDKPFDPSPWLRFKKVILRGANHYAAALPRAQRWSGSSEPTISSGAFCPTRKSAG